MAFQFNVTWIQAASWMISGNLFADGPAALREVGMFDFYDFVAINANLQVSGLTPSRRSSRRRSRFRWRCWASACWGWASRVAVVPDRLDNRRVGVAVTIATVTLLLLTGCVDGREYTDQRLAWTEQNRIQRDMLEVQREQLLLEQQRRR